MKILTFLAASAFANANAASKLYVCATPQNADLLQAQFEALDWTQITAVGSLGETGITTNILTYDTWDTVVAQKAKGITDAGSPDLECARIPGDPGQEILVLAGAVGNVNNYAFKEERNDGTVRYHRGLVAGPRWPGGRNEDFDLVVWTIAMQQEPITVNPGGGGGSGTAPELTVAPAITGTAEVGQVLTLDDGTFTGTAPITYLYQWFSGGVAISGATSATYTPVAGDVGNIITGRVTAMNPYGSATGFAAPTAAVTA